MLALAGPVTNSAIVSALPANGQSGYAHAQYRPVYLALAG